MIKKKVLVLATFDERGQGHGWSQAAMLKKAGFDVQFISLLRTNRDTSNFIIDKTVRYDFKYYWFKFVLLISQLLFAPFSKMRWFYKGENFATAKEVLQRLRFNPDYIIYGTFQYFLSPKEIFKLYKATKAINIFLMVDNKLLCGGCPYPPLGCLGYLNGCTNCKLYPYAKFIPKNVFKQKEKYLDRIPFHLVGTSYDLNKARKVSFLGNKKLHTSIGVPEIPFIKTKLGARECFGIDKDDYVIMAGAVNPKDPNKGFKELLESLNKFVRNVNSNKPITLLMLTKNDIDINLPKKIKICSPGFLDLDGLFTAYYACDVYASPSLEDSGPFMVNYAIACGRPVIAFNVGIAMDLVINMKTGWLANRQNIYDYAKGISFFYNMSEEELIEIEHNCKKYIESFKQNPWYKFMLN